MRFLALLGATLACMSGAVSMSRADAVVPYFSAFPRSTLPGNARSGAIAALLPDGQC